MVGFLLVSVLFNFLSMEEKMNIDYYNLEFIHITLRKILKDIEQSVGVEFFITSLYRVGDKGVHGVIPLRGVDLRMRNYKIGKEVEDLINKKWIYDPKRPYLKCALFHGTGYSLHLHIQCHDNTTTIYSS